MRREEEQAVREGRPPVDDALAALTAAALFRLSKQPGANGKTALGNDERADMRKRTGHTH